MRVERVCAVLLGLACLKLAAAVPCVFIAAAWVTFS